MISDRERIARDLHDVVIQRLFATGLQLESIMMTASPALRSRVDVVVEALDFTISDIRRTIFDLRQQ